MPHAMVLQSPPGNLTGPAAGPAYLKAYAQTHGYDVRVHDVGIDAFQYCTAPDRIAQLVDRAEMLRQRLESKGVLEPLEQRWYSLLLMAKGFALAPGCIAEAAAGFKDAQRFHDYARYKIDCKVLDSFFRLLRAVYYPTMVTPWDYPSAHALKRPDTIRQHLDADINPYIPYYQEVLFPKIAALRPELIGISMGYAGQSVQALVLGMLLKEQFPGIHITMGGAYLTQWTQVMEAPQLSFLFDATDSVICGEGEIPLVQLLDSLDNGADLSQVPNLIYLQQGTREIKHFQELVFTNLTGQAPPDYSDLDLDAYLIPEPVLPYMLTRGCYWQRCGFCQNRIGRYRPRPYQCVPVEKAVSELAALSGLHGCRHFHFCGDVMAVEDLQALAQSLLDSNTSIFWHTNLRAEKELTPALCDKLARAGLTSVAVGLESGSPQSLYHMDKGLDIPVLQSAIQNLYHAGVATQVTGIFGFPGESEAQAQMTVEFLMDHMHAISGFDVGLLLVLPGSAMHNDPAGFGVNVISYDQTHLRTPEPLWRAAHRIGLGAVNRLFEQLGRLEAGTCLINDQPYVGALCSNHTLLYFRQGPYILKRLRSLENLEHQQVHQIFGMDQHHRRVGEIKPWIPGLAFPYTIYRSPYLHERAHFGSEMSKHVRTVRSGAGWDYLLDPINIPQQIGLEAQEILARIDGQRDLETVLRPLRGHEGDEQDTLFLIRQVLTGLVVLANENETPRQAGKVKKNRSKAGKRRS
jgi:anaerobic magnesium-protoporphyrin IX monomethyl ester cyclase